MMVELHAGRAHRIHIRTNEGWDTVELVHDFDVARMIIRQAKCATNIMVRLEIDGRMVLRWDRMLTAGENRWKSVALDAGLPEGCPSSNHESAPQQKERAAGGCP